jgi:hypothetical protein
MFKNAQRIPGRTSPNDYHKLQKHARGDVKFIMSSGELKTFATCPDKYIHGFNFQGSSATKFGSLIDTRILTPDLFDSLYAVQPDSYESTGMKCPKCGSITDSAKCGKCKCERDPVKIQKQWTSQSDTCQQWIAGQNGKTVITKEELADCDAAIKRVMSKPTMKAFIEASDTQVMCIAEWHDEDTGLVIPFKILLDMVPRNDTEFFKSLGDFKSTRNAALIPFQVDAFKLGYHVSAALYRDIYVAATGEDRCNWVWLLAENVHPFQPGKRIMTEAFYDLGKSEYTRMLKNYCQCVKHGIWPDFEMTDESVGDWGIADVSPYMAERALFAPKFDFTPPQEVEAGEPDPDLIP